MDKVLLNILIGTLLGTILGVIAFFLRRFVRQNDDFQTKTLGSFKEIRRAISEQKDATTRLKFEIEQKLAAAGFDQVTKNKISSLLASVAKIEKELTKMKPRVEKALEDHGSVIVISDRLKAQDAKIKGLYDVVTKLVSPQKRQG